MAQLPPFSFFTLSSIAVMLLNLLDAPVNISRDLLDAGLIDLSVLLDSWSLCVLDLDDSDLFDE